MVRSCAARAARKCFFGPRPAPRATLPNDTYYDDLTICSDGDSLNTKHMRIEYRTFVHVLFCGHDYASVGNILIPHIFVPMVDPPESIDC